MSTTSRRSFALAASAFAALGTVRAQAQSATFNWKCGNDFGADHPVNVRLTEAFNKIRTASKGQLDIKLYPSSALGGPPAMVSQVRLGALELLATGGGALEATAPLAAVEQVAFVFKDTQQAYAAMDG